MKWHRDTIVFDIPQYEVVITLDNTSDSQFMWKYESEPDKFHRANTNTNSVTVVRAGGIKHAVSKVNRGERVIIKACYDVTTSELKSDEGPPGEFNKLTTIPKHPVYPAASV